LKGDLTVTDVALGTTDKQVAEKKLAEIVAEKERERAGLIAPKLQRESAQKPFSAHLADYLSDLATLGRCVTYRKQIKVRVGRMVAECGWKSPGAISVDSFVSWRCRQKKLGPKTLNEYLNELSAFLNWMVKQGRVTTNPVKDIPRVDIRGKQWRRRAFTDEEFGKLLVAAGNRRVIYITAAYTGLRLGELQQLVWGDLRLDHERPHIIARAATTKNRREALIPLHPRLVAELRLAKPSGVADDGKVFSQCSNPDRRIRLDMEKAGIVRIDAMGRKLDFHALRYTFATKLARSGISQRLAQELMRHSDPRLTANIYTDVTQLPTFEAVTGLAWHESEKGNEPTPPAAVSSQLDSQNSDFPGPNPAQNVIIAKDAFSPKPLDFQQDWRALAATGTESKMAEREGFEPSVREPVHMISNHAHSTTLSPLRGPAGRPSEGALGQWRRGRIEREPRWGVKGLSPRVGYPSGGGLLRPKATCATPPRWYREQTLPLPPWLRTTTSSPTTARSREMSLSPAWMR